MRLVKLDTSLRRMDADKRNSHRTNSGTEFLFPNRSINVSKERMKKGEVSFVVDRAGVKNAHAADGCTIRHRLPIRYTSTLPVQKLTDHTKETSDESTANPSKVRLAKPFGKGPQKIPRKNRFLRTQSLSDRYSTSKTAAAGRYHLEDDPRFSALKPGIISESLRAALGITHHQLPLYIYNMRRLGYPPGHLENARRQQSGILIFTNDGCEITPHGKVLEEGEVNDEQEEVLFDVEKLIDFPGFNMNPPDGTVDECEILDLPYMQADHCKEEMLRLLSSKPGKESRSDAEQNSEGACVKERESSRTIRCRVHAGSNAGEKRESDFWLSEMGLSAADGWFVLDSLPELDDDCCECSACPDSAVEGNSPNQSLPSQQSETRSVHNMLTPDVGVSLDECLTTEKTSCQAFPSFSQGSVFELELCSGSDFGEDVMPMSSDIEQKNSSVYGGSLDVTPGTPVVVVDSMSWSMELPDASCFSSGMSEPLPYENLPNATGAFKKLRRVLTAARLKRTRIY